MHPISNHSNFKAVYHPSKGLVERANRKLLDIIQPLVNDLHDGWEDWLLQIAAPRNSSVSKSMGKSPHYILYGVEKRLLYDLLAIAPQLVCNFADYSQ